MLMTQLYLAFKSALPDEMVRSKTATKQCVQMML